MDSTPFNWSRLIEQVADPTFGIPTDVTFQIVEDNQVRKVKAHKIILGMVSPMFKKMFFTTDVGDKTAKEINIKETTFAAFQIMIDAIYNTESIEDSLEEISVNEVFDVINLIERYQIKELQKIIRKYLLNYPVTDDTVLEVAADAMEYNALFQIEAQRILLTCAKFLKPKLSDSNSIMKYISENMNQKEAVSTLIAKIYEKYEIPCSNCNYKKKNCQNGKGVVEDEIREGIIITNNKGGFWQEQDCGTGKVTMVTATEVTMATIKPGITRNGYVGRAFNGGTYRKAFGNLPLYLYYCK